MALYDPVDGVYRKVSKKYYPVEGVYRKVKKAFDPVDGVYRQYFRGEIPVSNLAVGDSVWLNVNGISTEFILIHHGNPSSTKYDGIERGDAWLLAKDIYEMKALDTTNHDYENSDIHSYLQNTFLNLLDSNVVGYIKLARLPLRTGANTNTSATNKILFARVFLLSHAEVGGKSQTVVPWEGTTLAYFQGASDSKRIATFNGTATTWWLRTPCALTGNNYTGHVTATGGTSYSTVTTSRGLRPALVLDGNTPIDPSTHTIIT